MKRMGVLRNLLSSGLDPVQEDCLPLYAARNVAAEPTGCHDRNCTAGGTDECDEDCAFRNNGGGGDRSRKPRPEDRRPKKREQVMLFLVPSERYSGKHEALQHLHQSAPSARGSHTVLELSALARTRLKF